LKNETRRKEGEIDGLRTLTKGGVGDEEQPAGERRVQRGGEQKKSESIT